MRIPCVLVASLLALSASPVFADKVKLTIISDPAGATVYVNQSKQLMGYAPSTIEYEFERDFFKHGRCERIQPLTVRWASGAEASIDTLQLCGSTGKNQQFVFVRPADVPDRELDVLFALELQRLAAEERRASAERRSRVYAMLAESYRQRADASRRRLDSLRPMNCTSTMVGSYVYTTCQ